MGRGEDNFGRASSAKRAPRLQILRSAKAACATLIILNLARVLFAQNVFLPAPPPYRYIPKDERARLDETKNLKSRVALSLELSGERLSRAEELTNEQKFDEAVSELGIYQAIIEDALRALKEGETKGNRRRDLYRRFEIALRGQLSRLEAIRRLMPSEQAVNMNSIINAIKRARIDAINAFYGHVVIHDIEESASQEKSAADTMTKRKEP
ncbi:hypothetical protein [Pyrinomonas methylaliphatogenes]|uniref:DUF5667 domain-containing protein n=1 Tax=Pyrinomonas methylaliphatogenes TaxID=454194 RepID=A0A0B6WWG6_9BACT|nr:hypothetical protein [Pyrinomonas methylaliphatogenes]CDM65456.1 hypothetical protein PYK22_01457 [Pyrinomonas methylaliphatogenes]